ncbi:MAG: hypothetical protein V1808_01175 [Candidatus Daviesbacteria bacterium]
MGERRTERILRARHRQIPSEDYLRGAISMAIKVIEKKPYSWDDLPQTTAAKFLNTNLVRDYIDPSSEQNLLYSELVGIDGMKVELELPSLDFQYSMLGLPELVKKRIFKCLNRVNGQSYIVKDILRGIEREERRLEWEMEFEGFE